MAKNKTVYVCQNCGAESSKWIGHCPACKEWNSYREEIISHSPAVGLTKDTPRRKPELLSGIEVNDNDRITTGIGEADRILGGGMVKGSLILMGGEPGIGKSTLALQIALATQGRKVLYVSGEESEGQVKLRAKRLEGKNESCFIYNETELESVLTQAGALNPDLLIIDSIQTLNSSLLESSAGSVSQVRECAAMMLRYAKESGVPVILIGHITKDGSLAGPKVLEHIVDVVLQFEGDGNYLFRILRPVKNRFGSTAEIGIFEMGSGGLREVTDPSELFIRKDRDPASGVCIAATVDGLRPFMIETQALVSSAVYGTPQRSSTGFDTRRLNMLLAVLEKRAGFRLGVKDVFLNIAGGLKVSDPAIDLAVISAVLSSNLDVPVDHHTAFAGEVGLSGEIRPVARIEQRIMEASRMGFEQLIVSGYHRSIREQAGIKISKVFKVEGLVRLLFS
ncbi:MAG: DNA repair protein RadA [Bacteroidales bacterium]|jgi:DNA repair protein RadA/Sms|nr:DNA repair protein RadA [Bacteroidales bacterium]